MSKKSEGEDTAGVCVTKTATVKSIIKSWFCACANDSDLTTQTEDSYSCSDSHQSSYSPMTKALKIHLIWEKMLQNLKTRDLLTCRLVSSSWNNLFSSLLLHQCRQSPPLEICFKHIKGEYKLHQKYPKIPPRPLNDFVDLLENSEKHHTVFPFSNVSFKFRDGPLDDPDLQNFLNRYGGKIVDLDLEFSSPVPGFKDVPLVHQLPNARQLTLRPARKVTGYQEYFERMSLTESVVLRNLRSILGTEMPASFMEKIVEACPNVRAVSFALHRIESLPFLKYLMASGNLGLIKDFVFCPKNENVHEPYEEVFKTVEEALALNLRPAALEFDLSEWHFVPDNLKSQMTAFFPKLLNDCAPFVKKVKAKFITYNQAKVPCPVMPGVLELDLCLQYLGNGNPLQNFDLAAKFPNVQSLKLICEFVDNLKLGCPFVGVAVSVRKIEFSEGQSFQSFPPLLLFLPHLSTLFSNLEELILDKVQFFAKVCEGIWACSKLKVLKLTLTLPRSSIEMDSIFTGFSRDTCKRLGNHTMESLLNIESIAEGAVEMDSLRTKSSIVDLKHLERLDIKLKADNQKTIDPAPLMTVITGKYAFDCLPSLLGKVNIYVAVQPWGDLMSRAKNEQVRAALADIAPYTNIFHYYDVPKQCHEAVQT